MKILVFEYITGGGFNKQELPEALVHEGRLMLQALLDNFRSCADITVVVMLDERVNGSIDTAGLMRLSSGRNKTAMKNLLT